MSLMTRRDVFGALSAGLTARALAAPATPDRPNILFIYTDDHSHRTLSCYAEAYPWVRTPNIDRLASWGVRFTAAYNGAWCMPSRATLLTGHYQHGIESMRMEGTYPGSEYDPQKCPFWPKELRRNGYVTAQIGKWHTGTDTGFGRDWDYQLVWNSASVARSQPPISPASSCRPRRSNRMQPAGPKTPLRVPILGSGQRKSLSVAGL